MRATGQAGRAHGGSQPAATDGHYLVALVITGAIVAIAQRMAGANLVGLQARHDQPPFGTTAIDQLLRREARPCAQVGEVTLRRAWANADARRRARHGPTGRHEGGEDINLTGGPRPWVRAVQVPVFMPAASPPRATHPDPRSGSRRLLTRAQHLSGAPEQTLYARLRPWRRVIG